MLTDLVFIQTLASEGMDVDEDDDATQQPLKTNDFGIEVDYDDLNDEEREVSFPAPIISLYTLLTNILQFRMAHQQWSKKSSARSPAYRLISSEWHQT